MQKVLHIRTTVQPGGKIEIVDQGLPVGESVDVVVHPVPVSDHHHLYFRTPEGGERVIQTRYRSTASAMRKAKQVGGQLHFNRVLRDDFTVHIEPCPDSWSECHLWSGLSKGDFRTVPVAHCIFTGNELDLTTNYDIKYRMGREG